MGEHHELSAAMPNKVSELRKLLHAWRIETGAKLPTELNPDFKQGDSPWARTPKKQPRKR